MSLGSIFIRGFCSPALKIKGHGTNLIITSEDLMEDDITMAGTCARV